MQNYKRAIDAILAAGLSALDHENHCEYSQGVQHITIIGGVRPVEYYPSTGTVFANAVKNEFKMFRQKKAGINVAIRVARDGK